LLQKGRLSFKQYGPLKAAKFGIKILKLCESSAGCLWSFLVYNGLMMELPSPLTDPAENKTAAIVLNLPEPLLHCGHTLQMDNCFNFPDLAFFFQKKSTDYVSTLHVNRKHVPCLKEKLLGNIQLMWQTLLGRT
jgi:hypothetical protein